MEAPLGPADVDRLLQCLRNAISTDANTRSSAEAALQSLEGRPGYCSCLAVRMQPARGPSELPRLCTAGEVH